MTRNSIERYFEKRPSASKLYSVAGVVFTDPLAAAQYADMFGLVMETHTREAEEPGVDVAGQYGETTMPKAPVRYNRKRGKKSADNGAV